MDSKIQTKMMLNRTLVLALGAALCIAASFGFEVRSHSYETAVLKQDATVDTGAQLIDAHRFVRSDTKAVVSLNGSKNDARVVLTSGRIWLNTINAAYTTTVMSGLVTVTVPPSISTISYVDGKTTVEVLARYTTISIGQQKLFVPQNKGVVIYDATIKNYAKELQQILPSKFYKQFALYAFGAKDSWYTQNMTADAVLQKNLAQKFVDAIRQRGPRVSDDGSSVLQSFVSIAATLKSALTIDQQKKTEEDFKHALRYFDTALYHFNIGAVAEGKSMLATFESKTTPIKDFVQDMLLEQLDALATTSTDLTFDAARSSIQGLLSQPIFVANLNALYDSIRSSASPEQKDLVRSSMNALSTTIEKNVSSLSQKDAMYFSVMLNDLISTTPELMRENAFRSLALLQDQALEKATTKEVKVDSQQFFIAQKLEQLTLMKKYLDAGTIDFQQARSAMIFVAQTVELIKPLLSDSAFLPYFDAQYKTIEPFIGFLRSVETETLHGSYDKDFAEYKEKVRDAGYIAQLLNTATGGNGLSSIQREELGSIAAADLASTALTDIHIAFDDNEDSSVVIITSSKFDGAPFSARYDTGRKLFTSIVFDGKEVLNGVRLENLRTYLLVSRGKVTLENNATADVLTIAATDDRGAKIRVTVDALKKTLAASSISVDDKYIDTTNYDTGLIKVLLATRGVEPAQKLFSFVVATDLSTASNLEVQTVLGQIPVNDSFSLKELAFRVDQVFERAAFEKDKEGEVQNLLDRSVEKPGN